MKRSTHLTPGEFELLEILWSLGEASVKNVWAKVDPGRGLAYTTVMTVLEKMYRKGFLSQRKQGKAYIYSPILDRDQALQGVLTHVCEAYFGGSYPNLAGFVNRHSSAGPTSSAAPATNTPKAGEPTS